MYLDLQHLYLYLYLMYWERGTFGKVSQWNCPVLADRFDLKVYIRIQIKNVSDPPHWSNRYLKMWHTMLCSPVCPAAWTCWGFWAPWRHPSDDSCRQRHSPGAGSGRWRWSEIESNPLKIIYKNLAPKIFYLGRLWLQASEFRPKIRKVGSGSAMLLNRFGFIFKIKVKFV